MVLFVNLEDNVKILLRLNYQFMLRNYAQNKLQITDILESRLCIFYKTQEIFDIEACQQAFFLHAIS